MNPSPETSPRTAANPDGATSAPGAVVVRVPGPLRRLAAGADEVRIEMRGNGGAGGSASVAELLDALVREHTGLRRHLLTEEGAVRDYINIFVGDDDVRYLDGPATMVAAGETITIVPSIAGG